MTDKGSSGGAGGDAKGVSVAAVVMMGGGGLTMAEVGSMLSMTSSTIDTNGIVIGLFGARDWHLSLPQQQTG
jgi:hypothetical protein